MGRARAIVEGREGISCHFDDSFAAAAGRAAGRAQDQIAAAVEREGGAAQREQFAQRRAGNGALLIFVSDLFESNFLFLQIAEKEERSKEAASWTEKSSKLEAEVKDLSANLAAAQDLSTTRYQRCEELQASTEKYHALKIGTQFLPTVLIL